jgi:DNA-binding beta-propeller fold protein YncE
MNIRYLKFVCFLLIVAPLCYSVKASDCSYTGYVSLLHKLAFMEVEKPGVVSLTNARFMRGYEDTAWCISISQDLKYIATAGNDGYIYIWDYVTKKIRKKILVSKRAVLGVDFSPDGKSIVTSSADGFVDTFNIKTGNILQKIKAHDDFAWSVSYSPDGQKILSTGWDSMIKIWDANTGMLLKSSKKINSNFIWSAIYSPDGTLIASRGDNNSLDIRDANTLEIKFSFAGNNEPVYSLSFSRDGKYLASGSGEGIINVWETSTWKQLYSCLGPGYRVFCLSFSPDNKYLGCGSMDNLRLWDMKDGSLLYNNQPNSAITGTTVLIGYVFSIKFTRDGKYVIAGCGKDGVRIWDVNYEDSSK